MSEWQSIDTAPECTTVQTKIDDERGARNEQPLKRMGRLWFYPDGSMYVYYTPTHWRREAETTRDASIKDTNSGGRG